MKFLYTLFTLILAANLLADPNECPQHYSISTLEIGANYTHINLKVGDDSSFNGNMGGLQGLYEFHSCNNLYAALKATWRQGKAKNSLSKRSLVYVDVQERLGYSIPLCCPDTSLTLFSGFGYRFLGHKLKQSDKETIRFDYNEFYVPAGLLANYSFSPCFGVGMNVTWMPQVYPTVEINPLKGARWILKNTLKNVSVELPLTYTFNICNQNCTLILNPFYEHWEDGRSTAKTSSGEALDLPKNTYNYWGVELNIAFQF